MDAQRRKELKEKARSMRPPMGVLRYTCTATGERFLAAAPNLAARQSRIRLQAETNGLRNKRFQQLWNEHGEAGFTVDVAETLEYDDATEDYADDLAALLDACLEADPAAERI